MKNAKASGILISGIVFLLSWSVNQAVAQSSNYTVVYEYPLMNSFYRNMPLLADNYYDSADIAHLDPPLYLQDSTISFPYRKRAGYPHEVMFADNVNIVRFLGGWSAIKNNTTIADISQWDLAYRDANGKIQYRWNLIPARLDPILAMGYNSPNIVLDNTPWCFPLVPHEPAGGAGYGQCNPPGNMNEWSQFIADLCRELVTLYGYNTVNTWGFRVGTEDNDTTRFNGTADQYRAFYKATALAVQSVLPGAKVFPYNRAGSGTANLETLLSEARQQGFPYTTSPISTYSIGTIDSSTGLPATDPVNPDKVASGSTTSMWYDFDTITAATTLSREAQEYGWFLINELGDRDNAPGARGAAGNFYYMMTLRKYRLDKLFHWSPVDPQTDSQKNILTSQGFIYSVLDYCNDASRVVELNYTLTKTKQTSQLYKCVGFIRNSGKSYLLISGYNMNRYQKKINTISVYIPKSVFYQSNLKVTYTTLNDSTDSYRMLRTDLATKGLLYTQYANDSDFVPQYNTMSSRGKYWLQTNNDEYTQRIKQNLTLKPFNGQVQLTSDGTILTFPIHTPELFVIALEKSVNTDINTVENRQNIVSVFPTPAKDFLTINTYKPEEVEIVDLSGKLVKQASLINSNTLSMSDLQSGVYIACVKHNGRQDQIKIIKM